MKIIVLTLLSVISLTVTAQVATIDSNFHVYLLIGQSNMAGRGVIDTRSKKINERIWMLDSLGKWVPATDPVHFDKPSSAGVGPAVSFAETMLAENDNIRIGLIPCALGGSPIRVWRQGASYFKAFPYDDAVSRAKLAMQNGVLKGILWHQGESDNDSVHASMYMDELKKLIIQLRADLQLPALPFVAGEIGCFNKVDYINKIIRQLPHYVPCTAVVSASGLTDKGDKLHFDTTSARELGRRFAKSMKLIQRYQYDYPQKHPPVIILCFDDAEISHYANVAPMLKKYGFKATFMVCKMWQKQSDSTYFMNWSQIVELAKMGFEIGNHTGHHKNMTRLTKEEMWREVKYIEDKCKEYGIPRPRSFAYPGNRHDSLSQSVLKEMGYHYARTGGSKLYDPETDALLAIPSYTMGSSSKLAERTWSVLKTIQPGQILVFTIHGVPDEKHPDYTTNLKLFRKYLDYMEKHHFKVLSLNELGCLNHD